LPPKQPAFKPLPFTPAPDQEHSISKDKFFLDFKTDEEIKLEDDLHLFDNRFLQEYKYVFFFVFFYLVSLFVL
jgi:hypothetical protein